ncbi:TetR/AcrR family transcriptional regulator [Pseudonocardia cypriaca]|uniref:TetR family transcriptional regulator n=1 Tax=Pseudonocardia cypriaca TaxID=882449 RepID=A0A543GAC9_9PSEU|nr:TetR/AcrR family transcriptional regulator [Pseudonocardia cypriaca]TQM43039.1 TetR family transcriptional regulator [Pseudonocardia cypriaca]
MLGGATADWQSKRRESARREILSAAWDVARENGLAALTLREVAARVGMRAPSLYSHFSSKNAIYDAMFGQAWRSYEEMTAGAVLPAQPRAALRAMAKRFFEFAVADLPRNQLMNQRTIPGFTPSPESYAPAVRVIERLRSDMTRMGIADDGDVDLFIALVGGLADAQWANDPGGTRYARLLDRAVDMYADALHLPQVDDDQEET